MIDAPIETRWYVDVDNKILEIVGQQEGAAFKVFRKPGDNSYSCRYSYGGNRLYTDLDKAKIRLLKQVIRNIAERNQLAEHLKKELDDNLIKINNLVKLRDELRIQ